MEKECSEPNVLGVSPDKTLFAAIDIASAHHHALTIYRTNTEEDDKEKQTQKRA